MDHGGQGGTHGAGHESDHRARMEHTSNEKKQHDSHGADHSNHVDHSGHEQMFRKRFWVSLVLSIPVLLFSPMLQEWLGFSMPAFPGSQWITPVFCRDRVPLRRPAFPADGRA